MPAPLITKEEVLNRLLHAFRTYGYDGATLTLLSEATGLKRASLYHYFPGGKEEMGRAVLGHAGAWFRTHIIDPLYTPGDPQERLTAMVEKLDTFYRQGREACLIGALVLGGGLERFQTNLEGALERWITAIAAVLRDAGVPEDQARARAEDAVVRIQGALIVARGMQTTEPFRRTLGRLPSDLLASPK